MIPKLIHRLWLGPKEMPERYREYGAQWEALNPGWRLIDWDQSSLPAEWLRNKRVWDLIAENGVNSGAAMPADQAIAVQRADVAGYEIVYACGGVYVNCDIQPVRSIEPWAQSVLGDRAFAGFEDERYLVNAVIGGPKRHPFWDAVLDALEPRYLAMPGHMMNVVTGPHLMTDIWRRGAWRRSFYAAPREVFHPVHHGSIPAGSWVTDFDVAAHPETITVHHWGHRLTA